MVAPVSANRSLPVDAVDGFFVAGLMEAELGKRIMFGSDQAWWPEAIGIGIERIENATFLTAGQKRDILYNNAARFLAIE